MLGGRTASPVSDGGRSILRQAQSHVGAGVSGIRRSRPCAASAVWTWLLVFVPQIQRGAEAPEAGPCSSPGRARRLLEAEGTPADELAACLLSLRRAVAPIEGNVDPTALRELWKLEMRYSPLAGHQGVRRAIVEDLRLAEDQQDSRDPEWQRTRLAAARWLGDRNAETAALGALEAIDPCDDDVLESRIEEARRGVVASDAAQERQREPAASSVLAIELLRARRRLCPSSLRVAFEHFMEIRASRSAAEGELAATADHLLELVRNGSADFQTHPSLYFQLGDDALQRGLPAPQVEELLDADLDLLDERRAAAQRRARQPGDPTSEQVAASWIADRFANGELRVLLALRDHDLPRASRQLEALRSLIDPASAADHAELVAARARLATLETRLADLSSAAESPRVAGRDTSREPESRVHEKVAPSRLEFWQLADRPLPAFTLPDPEGALHSSSAWAGRVLFLNFWATWCQPCLREMPRIEELAARFGATGRVAFLTVAVDERAELVAPERRRRGWTIPTLIGASYFDQVQPDGAIPLSWIVDTQGRVVATCRGFDPRHGDDWIRETARLLEALSNGETLFEREGGAAGARSPDALSSPPRPQPRPTPDPAAPAWRHRGVEDERAREPLRFRRDR